MRIFDIPFTLRRNNFGLEESLTRTSALSNRIVLNTFAFLLSAYKLVLSVRLYACRNSRTAERIFMKFDIWGFHEMMPSNLNEGYNWTNIWTSYVKTYGSFCAHLRLKFTFAPSYA